MINELYENDASLGDKCVIALSSVIGKSVQNMLYIACYALSKQNNED